MRTDLSIVQQPSAPLFSGLLGAGSIVTDPNFGTKIARLTDGDTASYRSLYTSDDPCNLAWNTVDSMLIVRHLSQVSLLMQFDAKTMRGTLLPGTYNKACFSSRWPGILYTLIGTQLFQLTFILMGGVWTQQSSALLADFADILPVGFIVQWSGVFAHSLDDGTFTVAFSEGPQDTGHYVCVWRKSAGFRMLDTLTGIVTGEWGQTGTSTSRAWGRTVHEAPMTPNPQYGLMSLVGDSPDAPTVWELRTLNVVHGIQGGHHARGYLNYYASGVGGGQYAEVPYANPTTSRLVVPSANLPKNQVPHQTFVGAMHSGFGKVDRGDNSIFWSGRYAGILPFASAWQNEIDGYDVLTGIVYRACQTENSGLSTEFDVAHAMMIPSQTGKFVAYCSDRMGTLGSTSGAAQGTLGVDARGDIFVVQVG